ncbi:MAG: hypothetical protein AAGA69_03970 [Pseudomonadota bacterium]
MIAMIVGLSAMALQDVPVFDLLPEDQQARLEQCGVDTVELARLLELEYREFDQDYDGGWRAIAKQEGCELAAAKAIEAYIHFARPHGPGYSKILRWHAGQLYAYVQQTDQAIAFFRTTYDDPEGSEFSGSEWNLYVDATLAFLRDDYDVLVTARDRLAEIPVSDELKESRRKFLKDNPTISMPEGFVDAPQNLNVVQRFVDCFGEPYRQAYSSCDKAPSP